MKNQSKLNLFLAGFWAIVFSIIAIFTLSSTKTSPIDTGPTTVGKPQITQGEIDAPSKAADYTEAEKIKGGYWVLEMKDGSSYAFLFSENSRVDIYYSDNNEKAEGYSIYEATNNKVILKHLSDVFPIKEFTFVIKDNSLFYNGTKLDRVDKLN